MAKATVAVGLGTEDVEDAVLADGGGVHGEGGEKDDFGLVGAELMGNGETAADAPIATGARLRLRPVLTI